jgi:hypothetical protein
MVACFDSRRNVKELSVLNAYDEGKAALRQYAENIKSLV